jgi:hypothetical protein
MNFDYNYSMYREKILDSSYVGSIKINLHLFYSLRLEGSSSWLCTFIISTFIHISSCHKYDKI